MDILNIDCNYCHAKFSKYNHYIFHLETEHKINNYYVCPLQNCNRIYNKKNRFKQHLTVCYNSNRFEQNSCLDLQCTVNVSDHQTLSKKVLVENCIIDNSKNDHTVLENEEKNKSSNFKETVKSFLDVFLCHLYNIINLPRSLIQTFFELIKSLIIDIFSNISDLLNKNQPSASPNIMQEIMLDLQSLFDDLDTEYKRFKHLVDKNYYLAPVEIIIGSTKDKKKDNSDVIMILKERKIYMSPLRLVLKNFMELPGVFSDILNYQNLLLNATDVLTNIVQGTLWKDITDNINRNDNIIKLPLILYFDDFESGNSLGSHAGEYKLGAVYVSVATLPPEKSNRLENIFLAQLFYSKDRVTFGNKVIFGKLIQELKILAEEGIIIEHSNESVRVKFILVTLSGDNLGLHGILGFYESFMATNFCRFCLTTKTDSETQTCEIDDLRQNVNYMEDLENRLGIKEECVWNNLPNFHVYNNVTCDVMHDLVEGVHRYGMALVIEGLIEKEYFSLDHLNSRIKYFNYSACEKNKPTPIKNQHLLNKSIVMSASEMLCLTRNFSLMVGDLVAEDEPIWYYYLLLLELTYILMSQSFTSELIDYLKCIIEEHHQQYLNLFNSKLKPKHHFLIHYPTIIKKVGPPILISAFKYEAKHKELKKVCQSITCRKDLPLSVMKRCQLKQSFRYATKKGLIDIISYGKFILDNDDNVNCVVDWCEVNGIKYYVNNVVLLDVKEDIPEYYLINKIIVDQLTNEIKFYCFYLDILCYNNHLRAYNVKLTTQHKTIFYRELYTNLVSQIYKVNLLNYVKIDI